MRAAGGGGGGGAGRRERSEPRSGEGLSGGPRCDDDPRCSSAKSVCLDEERVTPRLGARTHTFSSVSVSDPLFARFPPVARLRLLLNTHASLKPVSSCSANHGRGEAARRPRNVPAPQPSAAPGGEGGGGGACRLGINKFYSPTRGKKRSRQGLPPLCT